MERGVKSRKQQVLINYSNLPNKYQLNILFLTLPIPFKNSYSFEKRYNTFQPAIYF